MSEELPDYICKRCGICMVDEGIREGVKEHQCKLENLVTVENTIKLRNRIWELENELSKV